MIQVQVLSLQYPERYALTRMVQAALAELRAEMPHLEAAISESSDPVQIGKYAFVLVLPTLVIDEKVFCSGCFPTKDEVRTWLRQAVLIDAKKRA